MTRISRRRLIAACLVFAVFIALFALFPGQRLSFAFTLATGIGKSHLQQRIDLLEDKAIRRADVTNDDKAFLVDFYRTLATGAELSVLVRQTGHLMCHYLDGSGSDFRLEPSIFTENTKVRAAMSVLSARAKPPPCTEQRFESPAFHMPDWSKIDSVFGLYFGTLELHRVPADEGHCRYLWRAEVPWTWPAYPDLARKYGTPHAENFPIPNLASLLRGSRYALHVENGLGEYLVHLGLAKPFLAYSEWETAP